MSRIFIVFFIILLSIPAEAKKKREIDEVYVNTNLPRYWKLIAKGTNKKDSVLEYVPKTQTQYKFKQKFIYKVVWNLVMPPLDYYKFLITNFERACGKYEFSEPIEKKIKGFNTLMGSIHCKISPNCSGNCNEYNGFYIIEIPDRGMIMLQRIYRSDKDKEVPKSMKKNWYHLFMGARLVVKYKDDKKKKDKTEQSISDEELEDYINNEEDEIEEEGEDELEDR